MPRSAIAPQRDPPDTSLDLLREPSRQTEAMKADWLGVVKAHHQMLERAFDELIDSGSDLARRPVLYKRLAYLLTAHSVAEENVIYPALAICGLPIQLRSSLSRPSARQGQERDARHGRRQARRRLAAACAGAARRRSRARQDQDEEGDLYPRLVDAIDAATATRLGVAYRREFLAVQPS